ncbi:methyltransferase dimerization domain-containing protein, partial [Burkholderia pseudomallei]
YRQSAILHYAVADKLFDLTQTGRSPAEVAASFGMVESKAAILLLALAALGLLTKDGDAFRNTALSARYLSTSRADYIGPIVEH